MGDSLGYIAALDIGTTTIRCQILNHQAKCVGASFDTVSCHFNVGTGYVKTESLRSNYTIQKQISWRLTLKNYGIPHCKS